MNQEQVPYILPDVPVIKEAYNITFKREKSDGQIVKSVDFSIRNLPISSTPSQRVHKQYYSSKSVAIDRANKIVNDNPDKNITYEIAAITDVGAWNHYIDAECLGMDNSEVVGLTFGCPLIITGTNLETDFITVIQ